MARAVVRAAALFVLAAGAAAQAEVGRGPLLIVQTGSDDAPSLAFTEVTSGLPAREFYRSPEGPSLWTLAPVARLDRDHVLLQPRGLKADVCVVGLNGGDTRRLTFSSSWFVGVAGDVVVSIDQRKWTLQTTDWRTGAPPRELRLHGASAGAQRPPQKFGRACTGSGACYAIGVRSEVELWRIDVADGSARLVAPLPEWTMRADWALSPDEKLLAVWSPDPRERDGALGIEGRSLPVVARWWRLRVFDCASDRVVCDWDDIVTGQFLSGTEQPRIEWCDDDLLLPMVQPVPVRPNEAPTAVKIAYVARDPRSGKATPCPRPVPGHPLHSAQPTRVGSFVVDGEHLSFADGKQPVTDGDGVPIALAELAFTADGRHAAVRTDAGVALLLDGERRTQRRIAEHARRLWFLPEAK